MKGDQDIAYFARTNHRDSNTPFGIRRKDRRSHMYIVGKTGTGKSHLLRIMIEQDLRNGESCALFDPHGDLVRSVRDLVPKERESDVVYLDATDPATPWRFNPFANVPIEKQPLAAAGLVEVFKKIWPDEWGPRLEHLLRNVVYTLLATPGSSLADIPVLLADRTYRSRVVSGLHNDVVTAFWKDEFERYSPGFRSVVMAPLQNKVGALLTDPVLHRLLTEDGRQVDLRKIMDEGRVLLVNLDKGLIGEGPSAVLGSFLLSHIALAGISRSDQPEIDRRDFFVYLDEFQTFTTLAIATMLSELRKYRVGLTLAHQHLSQLEPDIRDSVFGNVGTVVSFRVGAADAGYLAKEFAPLFSAEHLTALPKYHVYVRLLIEGEVSRAFSATTITNVVSEDSHSAGVRSASALIIS
jgi:DNA helicase HerA-like ATPase